ncbi:MAG: tRNA uridine-5-carboxymethylaminomethyl(34) synthesis GTPase MnmE [Opitutaceae bacterium]|nr:tRNA uridine-5-carboxymethylaminomethyl(34) synthesis GTPase MnmE [Opitutaceae bacterium]
MPGHHDTIAALATPQGTSAIAVIRASGPDTRSIAEALGGGPPLPRTARRADYRSRSGELIDTVIATWFAGPNSYTGEDTLEISCHGNPFIAHKILEDLLARGCRSAEPGEFTQRAFLNGKLDLTQAEAVMDVIHASSDIALASANAQLRGGLAKRIEALIGSLLDVLAHIEAYIDFPDEDLPPTDRATAKSKIIDIIQNINILRSSERYRSALRDGFKVVIAGPPNAGKSSLLNRLVGRDRALVSPEPGTTRDFIEERIIIGGHLVRIFDTAGIRESASALESLGIDKSLELIKDADVVLMVFEASIGDSPTLPDALADKLKPNQVIVVLNKSDLPNCAAPTGPIPVPFSMATVRLSALYGHGVETLISTLSAKLNRPEFQASDGIAVNARHAEALDSAAHALSSIPSRLGLDAQAIELVASDIRAALAELSKICGDVDNERMLDRLFAAFCIGK